MSSDSEAFPSLYTKLHTHILVLELQLDAYGHELIFQFIDSTDEVIYFKLYQMVLVHVPLILESLLRSCQVKEARHQLLENPGRFFALSYSYKLRRVQANRLGSLATTFLT